MSQALDNDKRISALESSVFAELRELRSEVANLSEIITENGFDQLSLIVKGSSVLNLQPLRKTVDDNSQAIKDIEQTIKSANLKDMKAKVEDNAKFKKDVRLISITVAVVQGAGIVGVISVLFGGGP